MVGHNAARDYALTTPRQIAKFILTLSPFEREKVDSTLPHE